MAHAVHAPQQATPNLALMGKEQHSLLHDVTNAQERTTIPESFTHAYVHSDLLRHIGPTAAITAMDTMPATLRTRV